MASLKNPPRSTGRRTVKNAKYLDHWFLPDTVTVVNGKPYTNATCRELTLTLDDDGIWRGQMDRYADGSTELTWAGCSCWMISSIWIPRKTIPNPYYDSIPSGFTGIDGSGKSSSNAYHKLQPLDEGPGEVRLCSGADLRISR